jgi:hypothetical protein
MSILANVTSYLHTELAGTINHQSGIWSMMDATNDNVCNIAIGGALNWGGFNLYQTSNGAALETGDTYGTKHLITNQGTVTFKGGESCSIYAGIWNYGGTIQIGSTAAGDVSSDVVIYGHHTAHTNTTAIYMSDNATLLHYGGNVLSTWMGKVVLDSSIYECRNGYGSNKTVTYTAYTGDDYGDLWLYNGSELMLGGVTSTGELNFDMSGGVVQIANSGVYTNLVWTGSSCLLDRLTCISIDRVGTTVASYNVTSVNTPSNPIPSFSRLGVDCSASGDAFSTYVMPAAWAIGFWDGDDLYVNWQDQSGGEG